MIVPQTFHITKLFLCINPTKTLSLVLSHHKTDLFQLLFVTVLEGTDKWHHPAEQ